MYTIISDIHGCFDEFKELTLKLGYTWSTGVPLHNEKKLVFVGDITDRGPHSLKMIEIVHELVIVRKKALYSPGNHCNKLYRYFLGRKVQITHGLDTTVAEYQSLSKEKQKVISCKMIELYESSPLYLILDNNQLVTSHAGIKAHDIGKFTPYVERFVLYGDITGEKHPDGFPVRGDWAKEYDGNHLIVYGHTPVIDPRVINNTINIDTGCVFGGKLTALSYPEIIFTSVPSKMEYIHEKFTVYKE